VFEEILACLDGSPLAERILPLASALSGPTGGKLTLLRVVSNQAEIAAQGSYLSDLARRFGGDCRLVVAADPAGAICAELERHPRAIAALTTHGRSAWAEAIIGSVALRVVGEARRPVILFRPLGNDRASSQPINTVAVALDGSELSEKMISCAVKAARSRPGCSCSKLCRCTPPWA